MSFGAAKTSFEVKFQIMPHRVPVHTPWVFFPIRPVGLDFVVSECPWLKYHWYSKHASVRVYNMPGKPGKPFMVCPPLHSYFSCLDTHTLIHGELLQSKSGKKVEKNIYPNTLCTSIRRAYEGAGSKHQQTPWKMGSNGWFCGNLNLLTNWCTPCCRVMG